MKRAIVHNPEIFKRPQENVHQELFCFHSNGDVDDAQVDGKIIMKKVVNVKGTNLDYIFEGFPQVVIVLMHQLVLWCEKKDTMK